VFLIMNRKLTLEQRVFLLKNWWKFDRDYTDVIAAFEQQFPGAQPPIRQAIYKLNKKFEQTGSVNDLPRSGRPRSVRTLENMEIIAETFVKSPKKSARKASNELDISDRSLRRILHSDLKLKPYRPKLLQALHEDDPDRRVEFCEQYIIRQEADNNFYKRILWSDEATFKLNGRINRHNCVYWAAKNPHAVISHELNVPGVTVWAGIWSGGVIGPYFYDGTVNAENYLEMLHEVFLELENSPTFEQLRRRSIIWQQDGAPPHYGLNVRACLNDNFDEWIGRRGTIEWPARSPDLTPCDFSMWGLLKEHVFSEKPQSLEHLKELITKHFDVLFTPQLCNKICKSVLKRCYKCIDNDGGHFEQLL
jgi:hypothetical protein